MSKPKNIETPEALWRYFNEYRDEKKSDPILIVEFVGKDGRREEVPKQRPLTIDGFASWLHERGITSNLHDYLANTRGAYDDYSSICRAIKDIIRADQIEGGMAGIYNPSITQRLNGLVDKSNVSISTEQPLFPDTPQSDEIPSDDGDQ